MKSDIAIGILNAKEVAVMLKKAPKWVYNHADKLNGRKIGGSLFFTTEGVLDAIQRSRKVERGYKNQRETGETAVFPFKKRCGNMGAGRGQEAEDEREALARRAGLTHFL